VYFSRAIENDSVSRIFNRICREKFRRNMIEMTSTRRLTIKENFN